MPFPADHARDNPWWRTRDAIDRDPDLERLADQPARYDHEIPFHLDVDAVYTLRGPRQVGKSTLLKRMAERLLRDQGVGTRDLFYLDAEGAGIRASTGLHETLAAFLDWSRSADPDARKYLLLDEVTGVTDWGTTIRVLHRRGELDRTTAVVTGSHALDLQRGGETAPGRRGERHGVTLDWIMMPFGFREFVLAHRPDLACELAEIDLFDPRSAFEAAGELSLRTEILRPLFDRYLLSGGYPYAMAAEATRQEIPKTLYDQFRHAVVGQMRRAGHQESYFREIVAWAADRGLGREFSWRDGSGETRIGSKDTVRAYVEDAEAMFLWHVLYRSQTATDTARALRSPKKLYPADPFAWHALAGWTERDEDPWSAAHVRLGRGDVRGTMAESVAADHFQRRFGPGVAYHRTSRGTEEIDFLISRPNRLAYVEIKYRSQIRAADRKWLAKYGGGVLATRDTLAWHEEERVAALPLWALLSGYPEPVSLYPSPG